MSRYRPLIFLFTFLFFQLIGNAQSLILPQEVGNKISSEIGVSNVTFYEYPYVSDLLDIRDFKKKYPNLIAPDTIRIQTNAISSIYKLTVLIGIEDKERTDKSDLIIWLAGDYHTDEVLFFLNKDQDRNFSTNPDFLRLTSSDAAYTVVLNKNASRSNPLKLKLKVPKKKNVAKIKKSRFTKRILNQVALGLHINVGTGELKYEFDNLERGFPTWYDINFTEKGLGLELSYNLPLFRFAIMTNYNNSFSYTSYLNIRYDEPEAFTSPVTGRTVIMQNVDIQQNTDLHARNKVDYAGLVGLRLHFKSVEIQPFISLGQTVHLPGEYSGNRHSEVVYNLPASLFYEAGLRLEFSVAEYRAIYFDFNLHRGNWRPDGFFETIPHENLQIDHTYFKFKAGYRLGL